MKKLSAKSEQELLSVDQKLGTRFCGEYLEHSPKNKMLLMGSQNKVVCIIRSGNKNNNLMKATHFE